MDGPRGSCPGGGPTNQVRRQPRLAALPWPSPSSSPPRPPRHRSPVRHDRSGRRAGSRCRTWADTGGVRRSPPTRWRSRRRRCRRRARRAPPADSTPRRRSNAGRPRRRAASSRPGTAAGSPSSRRPTCGRGDPSARRRRTAAPAARGAPAPRPSAVAVVERCRVGPDDLGAGVAREGVEDRPAMRPEVLSRQRTTTTAPRLPTVYGAAGNGPRRPCAAPRPPRRGGTGRGAEPGGRRPPPWATGIRSPSRSGTGGWRTPCPTATPATAGPPPCGGPRRTPPVSAQVRHRLPARRPERSCRTGDR